jgi:hypothetical protein
MCDLHLRDELHKDAKGNLQRYYRLHAYRPHTIERVWLLFTFELTPRPGYWPRSRRAKRRP